MKKTLLTALLIAASVAGAQAQTMTEWMDKRENGVNRLPSHTSFFSYENESLALQGDPSKSANFLSLHGQWKFMWCEHADARPTDFFRTDYDDRQWGTMPVPGMWELNGYGDPVYLNIGFAWRGHYHMPSQKDTVPDGALKRVDDPRGGVWPKGWCPPPVKDNGTDDRSLHTSAASPHASTYG